MTDIAFHFNAPDACTYACRLVRKALGTGSRLVVTGPPDLLEALDVALWRFSALDFLPHASSNSPEAVQRRSPVLLAASPPQQAPAPVLVNLGMEVPMGFERYERLIEVVTADDLTRQQARLRWSHYRDRGYAIQRHDLAGAAA